MLHYNVIRGITIPSPINFFIDSFKILVFQVKLANFWFLFTSVQDNVYAYFSRITSTSLLLLHILRELWLKSRAGTHIQQATKNVFWQITCIDIWKECKCLDVPTLPIIKVKTGFTEVVFWPHPKTLPFPHLSVVYVFILSIY